MALIIPPGYLQAVYEMSLAGDPEQMVVTLGHEIDSASGANLDDAANDLFTAFATTVFVSGMASGYRLDGVTVYGGNDGPSIVRTSTNTPVTGAGSAAVLPPNCAVLVRKRTDLAGRRGRGRLYMPGPPESGVDQVGNLAGAEVTANQNRWSAFYDYLTSLQGGRLYPPVVLHRSEGAGVEPPPTPVTQFTVDPKIATQRRRLRP